MFGKSYDKLVDRLEQDSLPDTLEMDEAAESLRGIDVRCRDVGVFEVHNRKREGCNKATRQLPTAKACGLAGRPAV